ncbi:MAG: GNAT family N-acetyltransferase [Ignisphaera sp.]|nr:GNAT family N-acetyltransferase [Ignisphaera sp.]MCX8168202.1 GNAT family N-acetyltransferase [Ignisphaera sp.]MDW8084928.1 N-acetyltransferase [Ignisphaera sp.]
MNLIRIRPATMDDIDMVIAINIECLPEHYPFNFWIEHLKKWGDIFYVAEVDNEIVGYVLSRIEEGQSHFKGSYIKMGHIVSVAVKGKFRRKGIATYMLLTLLNSLKTVYGAEEAFLEVRVSNEPAVKLYEKLGFTIVKKLTKYYLDGEDALLMAKAL